MPRLTGPQQQTSLRLMQSGRARAKRNCRALSMPCWVASGQAAREVQLSEQGVAGIPAIRALAKRVQLLVRLARQMGGSGNARAVVEAQGKAIFWKEKGGVERQLKRWSPERLATLADRLLAAERAIKSPASPGDIMADAEMITIARAAQRAR
jgi:DNA polymerase-3 subunit delta